MTYGPNYIGPDNYTVAGNGCWLWRGHINNSGYPRITVARKSVYAHRHYYEKYKGPIPDGFDVDHTCRHRSCVNPEHLEAVSRSENLRRSWRDSRMGTSK